MSNLRSKKDFELQPTQDLKISKNLEIKRISGKKETKNKVSILSSTTISSPLRLSLFSNMPPTINFTLHSKVLSNLRPEEVRNLLTWKKSRNVTTWVNTIAKNAGFLLLPRTSDCECSAIWSQLGNEVPRNAEFRDLKPGQKICRFPGTESIGNKWKLWKNIRRMILKFGEDEFGFQPKSFCLPAERKLLSKERSRKGFLTLWIVKPPNNSEGRGIKIVTDWSKIPRNKEQIVQRYLHQPYLINQTKFDLRLYVLITSMDPLRVFLYDNGLLRFATNKYTNDIKSITDNKTHLTNSGINKTVKMLTLKSLWRHFEKEGIDHLIVWEKIKDVIVKTIISAENIMATQFESNVNSRYSCYEFFGFDIILDFQLKPWLLEVNRWPSLGWKSNIECQVKWPLVVEILNLARYHLPSNLPQSTQRELADRFRYGNISLCLDDHLYSKVISKIEQQRQDLWMAVAATCGSSLPPLEILDNLTPDDTRHLLVAEDELAISKNLHRVFPTATSHKYLKFMEKPRYYNLLLAAWEIKYAGINKVEGISILQCLSAHKYHLKVPTKYEGKTQNDQQTINISVFTSSTDEPTNDDIKSVDDKLDDIESMDVKLKDVESTQEELESVLSKLSDSEGVKSEMNKNKCGWCAIL